MPEEVKKYREQLEGRTMLVKKAKVIPLEAIVRGYITGVLGSLMVAIWSSLLTARRIGVVGVQTLRDCPRDKAS